MAAASGSSIKYTWRAPADTVAPCAARRSTCAPCRDTNHNVWFNSQPPYGPDEYLSYLSYCVISDDTVFMGRQPQYCQGYPAYLGLLLHRYYLHIGDRHRYYRGSFSTSPSPLPTPKNWLSPDQYLIVYRSYVHSTMAA